MVAYDIEIASGQQVSPLGMAGGRHAQQHDCCQKQGKQFLLFHTLFLPKFFLIAQYTFYPYTVIILRKWLCHEFRKYAASSYNA